MTGIPGGVFVVNDGMPTQVTPGVPGGPLRQSLDCIGISDGAFRIHLMSWDRLSG